MRCRKTIQLKARSRMGQRIVVPCGQCLHCRINKRDRWACRVLLESQASISKQFWTLTLSDQGLATFHEIGPRKMYTNFLTALRQKERRRGNEIRVRSFGVLEFGTRWERPHYHLTLFNALNHVYEETPWLPGLPRAPIHTDLWPHGHLDVMPLNTSSARYVAKYVTKFNDPTEQQPLEPLVFHAQRPPLGYTGLKQHLSDIANGPRKNWVQSTSIEIDGKNWELDQTMQRHFLVLCRRYGLKHDQTLPLKHQRLAEQAQKDARETDNEIRHRVQKETFKERFYEMAAIQHQAQSDAQFLKTMQIAQAIADQRKRTQPKAFI